MNVATPIVATRRRQKIQHSVQELSYDKNKRWKIYAEGRNARKQQNTTLAKPTPSVVTPHVATPTQNTTTKPRKNREAIWHIAGKTYEQHLNV